MADSNAKALRDLAQAHLAEVLTRLPNDRMDRFVLFIEAVRAMDYWGISAYPDSLEKAKAGQSLDLMYWGWNRAVAELFESRVSLAPCRAQPSGDRRKLLPFA